MRPLLRPAEMAAADRLTIEKGTPGAVLMERAGRAVARAVIDVAGGRYGVRALIVCGKGNNGGDGFVAARMLAREGVAVTCALVTDPSEIGGDAAHHLALMERAGVRPVLFGSHIDADRFDVVVDAIFGTGFRGEPDSLAAQAIDSINGHAAIVAVDLPSGVDGSTGAVAAVCVRAVLTVALGTEKIGTALPPGATHGGVVRVVDIGIDTDVRKFEDSGEGVVVDSFVEMAEAADVAASLPVRSPDAHKRSTGSVVVIGGSDEITGAPLLTCLGAMRMGAGYVTLGSTPRVGQAAGRISELLFDEVAAPVLTADAVGALKPALERADAVAVGPGLGTGAEQAAAVNRILAEVAVPVVVDADGLNVLAEDPTALVDRRHPMILTPHPAELARLLGMDTRAVVADRLAAALTASERFPAAVVVAKGYRTVVAYAGGRAAVVIPVGGPELATAGTGDVLTGVIAALLAREVPPPGAAIDGAYIHGLAGSVAGSRVGRAGVLAGDVAEATPEAIELLSEVPVR